ncbi:MAG: hypothetical protein ACTSXD_08715 [Candidatus Heimdallarchaeaceae archaeon]
MARIKFNFKNPLEDDGTFISADTSVELEDSEDAYGVKRNDTDDVVVASGTAMVEDSTGMYSYEFQEPEFNLTYSYAIKVVHDSVTYYFVFDDFEGTFYQFNTSYATPDELAAFNSVSDDGNYADYLKTASQMIDDFCNRKFYDDFNINKIPTIIHKLCMIIADRIRLDPSNEDTNAVSESIGRYSYTGNSNSASDINGLIPSEYNRLIPYRRLKSI